MELKQELIKNIKSLVRETSQNYPHEEMVELPDVLNEINQLDEAKALPKEWFKEEVSAVLREVFNNHALDYVKYIEVKGQLERLFDQLDEPEVLSQEWIDENKSLINGRSTNPDGTEGDCYDAHYIHVLELQNLLVPKQELPVIPKFVAYVIEAYKSNSRLTNLLADLAFHGGLAEFVEHEDKDEVFEWARSNRKATDEILARAWLYGYKVEEEQKYIVSDNSSIPLLIKNDSGEIMSYDSQIAYNNSNGTIELTEQEIKDYDERYWPFAVKVEELEE